jgi:hypothetical protein
MIRRALTFLAAAAALTGCGVAASSSSRSADPGSPPLPAAARTPTQAASPTSATSAELSAAEHPRRRQFPAVGGRTLAQIAADAKTSVQLTAASSVNTLGSSRYAFGLSSSSGAFIYAPSAVYVAASPQSRAAGPFLAPADPITVAPRYRSAQNSPFGVRAIYDTQLPTPHPGVYVILVLTRTPDGLEGSSSEIALAASSPIPGVGQRPPDIATDTLASVHGNVALLTTRQPPENMHAVSFDQVLGKRPIALLFSTPELCQSRVCGPVTDIMVELQHEFAGRIVFIHEEVFVDNEPTKGLRPQLKAFHLETEPWLFTVNAAGTIAARLSGAFGVEEARSALEAALK